MTMVATRVKGTGPKPLQVTFTIVASGSYPAGGDALDFGPVARFTNRQPDIVQIAGIAGFIYQYDSVGKRVIVYCNTAGGADAPLGVHSTGAYAAGVTGDTIKAECIWFGTPGLTS